MKIDYPRVKIETEPDQKDVIKLKEEQLIEYESIASLDKRNHGNLRKKSFFLPTTYYDWIIVKDDCGVLCLVPLKKTGD